MKGTPATLAALGTLEGFLPRLRLSASQPRGICKSKMSGLSNLILPKFASLEDGKSNSTDTPKGFRFRLVSYNILAQVYVKSSYFPHSPSSCLKWKARSQAILTDLKNFNADFLCIQELDEYENFYKGNMENHGYSGIYIQRSGQKRDGCGIFYKTKSAELVLEEEIHYNDLVNSITDTRNTMTMDAQLRKGALVEDSLGKNGQSDHGDPNDPCVRLKRDCVGLLTAFKLNDPSNPLLIVGNTHIYWDPEWVDVKLAQAEYLLSRLAQFKKVVSERYNCMPSVIVAGDFNSTPGDKVYQYLVSRSTTTDYVEASPIRLYSLYAENGGEPPFTNCTPGFTGTLDYIFLSDYSCLKPVSLLEVPGPESGDTVGGLPNEYHPSDHLPIGGDFEVMVTNTTIVPKLQDGNPTWR